MPKKNRDVELWRQIVNIAGEFIPYSDIVRPEATPRMPPELDNYDWEQAFQFATEHISEAEPESGVALDPFTREDVKRIIAIREGENDGQNWFGVFELHDGRFATVNSGCDCTGWDRMGFGESAVADSEINILMFGLGDEERIEFGIDIWEE